MKYQKINLILLLSIGFLPSCFKNDGAKNESNAVVITVDGKSILNEKQLEDFIGQALEANPQAKVMYTIMPEAIKEQALEAKKQMITIAEWAKREGIHNSAEYKKRLNQAIEGIHAALDQEEFIKRHKPEISEQAIVEFYEQHKHEPQFMMGQAGIKAVGVEFATKDQADKFAQELAGKAANVARIAESKKLTVKEYGVVNKDAFAPKAVKAVLETVKTFPTVKVVKDDKNFVVIVALAKEDAKIYPLEDVKEGIKRMLESRTVQEAIEKHLPEYQKKFNIQVDENYKANLKAQSEQRQDELRKKMSGDAAQAPAPQGSNVA